MAKRFLTGRDFEAALDFFKGRGLTSNQLCTNLGCSNNQVRRWLKIGAPRHIALALAAIGRDLAPWQPTRQMLERLDKKERARGGAAVLVGRDKEIIALRELGLTLEEIGLRFGISKERVRQIVERPK